MLYDYNLRPLADGLSVNPDLMHAYTYAATRYEEDKSEVGLKERIKRALRRAANYYSTIEEYHAQWGIMGYQDIYRL